MKNIKYILIFFFIHIGYGQNFEGQVTYKTTIVNPDPELYSAEYFREEIVMPAFGKQGFRLQKYFYKGSRFKATQIINFKPSYELYVPERKQIFKWKKGVKKGEVINVDENPLDDTLVKIIETNEVESIVNIECKKIIFEFEKIGQLELWYNSDCLKINKEDYQDFKLDFKNIIFDKLGCLPFKAKVGYIVNEIIAIKEEKVSDKFFQKPDIQFVKKKK